MTHFWQTFMTARACDMEWRTVVDFPDYLVSEDGVVKNRYKNNIIVQYEKRGYMRVRLNRDKKRYDVGVHQVVAKAFVDGFKPGLEVNHIDKNRKNTHRSNLEWLTHADNVRYSRSKPVTLEYEDGSTLRFPSITACANFFGETGPLLNMDKYIKMGRLPLKWGFRFVVEEET